MCTVWAALFLFLSPFSFRYRFAALLRTPSPHTHPSLLSICPFPRLSTAFPFSSLPPTLQRLPPASLRSFFPDSPSSSVLLPPAASLFSCYLFVFRALDFSPASFTVPPFPPSRFFLSLMPRLLSSFRSSTTTDSSLSTPSSRAAFYLPPFRPSLHTPAASVETARFFPPVSSAPTFFTPFFSPSPPLLRRLPMRRSPPRHRNIASSIRSVSLSPVSHIRTWSFSPSRSRLSSALFLLSFVHLSLPSRLSFIFPCLSPPPLSLSFASPPLSPPAAPIFLIFFSQLPDHLPTPRVGVLFLSGRSSRPSARPRTRVHTYALAACASGRDEEIKKGVKRELVDVGGKGGPTGAREKGG